MASAKAEAAAGAAPAEETSEVSLLDQIVSEGRFSSDKASMDRGKDIIKEFVSQVLEGHVTITRDTEAAIQARIAQIDRLISVQLNEVLHHASFQKLEGSWRGLKYLLDQSETNDMLKIKVLNVSKKDLLKDMQRASEFDQSAMFKKVYEEEFGVFGGAPFAAMVGDFEFGRGPEDLELLEKISNVAAAAHAPFLSAASPELLNLKDFTQLGSPRDMAKSSIRRSTPSGNPSGRRRIHATSRLPCRTCLAGCRTEKTPSRWRPLTTKRTSMAPSTTSIFGATLLTPWAHD